MRRRNFLKMAGGAAWPPSSRPLSLRAQEPSNAVRPEPPLLSAELLRNRNQNRSTVACRHGMVCSSQPLASMAGVDILKAGGNAVDAAIATNAMLSLTEPMMCGPGGDLFAIVWSEKDRNSRPQRQRPRALRLDARKGQIAGAQIASQPGPAVVERAGLRQRLGYAA